MSTDIQQNSLSREDKIRLINLKRTRVLQRARKGEFKALIAHIKKDYDFNWHHIKLADKLEAFLKDPNKKKLAVFMPPQHGKSELTTRLFPIYALGEQPNLKIAICSYSADLAKNFNRTIQRYIDSPEYAEVYPETKINGKNVVTTTSWLRNSEEFEIIDKQGSLKAVGVQGGLSGKPVDLAIIDDPIKDYKEAQSAVTREAIWNWYVSVLSTRLHNNSKQILIMTRWHTDDLAGRLLNSAYTDDENFEPWEVVNIPAILEVPNEDDPRKVGQVLWPKKHSINKILTIKSQAESIFNSLYQQNPIKKGGNKVNEKHFKWVDFIPDHLMTPDLWVDGAYTEKTKNDPSGIMEVFFDSFENKMYVSLAVSKRLEMPSLIKEVTKITENGKFNVRRGSTVRIEPKASGKSLGQMLNTQDNMAAVEIDSYLVSEGKEARLQLATPFIEAGRIYILNRPENRIVVDQITGYPNVAEDEFVDLVGYACDYYFKPDLNGDQYSPIGLDNLV
jgi:predicted phage terminase large subunit-like protein